MKLKLLKTKGSFLNTDKKLQLRLLTAPTVVALGDSSVYGVGDCGNKTAGSELGWTGRLAHDLNAGKYINLSRNGARAQDVWQSQLAAAVAARPDLVLICIGGNDALRNNFKPVQVAKYLYLTISNLQATGAVVAILGLHDPSLIAPAPKIIKNILRTRVLQINAALRWVSDQTSATLIETIDRPEIYERKFWHIDRMHPGPIGHQYISDLVRRTLSLPRRSGKKIQHETELDRKAKAIWLITNGFKWLARRSIDLLPAMLFLVGRELIKSRSLNWTHPEYFKIYLEHILSQLFKEEISKHMESSKNEPLNFDDLQLQIVSA